MMFAEQLLGATVVRSPYTVSVTRDLHKHHLIDRLSCTHGGQMAPWEQEVTEGTSSFAGKLLRLVRILEHH